jgi:peroxiredoxin
LYSAQTKFTPTCSQNLPKVYIMILAFEHTGIGCTLYSVGCRFGSSTVNVHFVLKCNVDNMNY